MAGELAQQGFVVETPSAFVLNLTALLARIRGAYEGGEEEGGEEWPDGGSLQPLD